MIDNKRLTQSAKISLEDLTYASKVEIWEKYCSDCPFKIHKFQKFKDSRTVDISKSNRFKVENEYLEIEDSKIIRGCNFGDQEFSLDEVIRNTCRFWKLKTDEGGDNPDNRVDSFTEINDMKEIEIG